MPSIPGTVNWPTALDDTISLFDTKNNKATTLTGGINAAVTTIPVASTAGFPSTGAISIDLEIIYYTSTDATNFLGCTRASDGTAAAAHTNGTAVEERAIARLWNVLRDALIALETALGTGLGAPPGGGFVIGSSVAGTSAWVASTAGANTALSNLASVAINAPLATGAGVTFSITATAPAIQNASQAGINVNVRASDAVAGSVTAGAAAGGSVQLTAGDAKRLTSGNANGGNITLSPGAGIGTGTAGAVVLGSGQLQLFSNASATFLDLTVFGATTTGFRYFSNGFIVYGGGSEAGFIGLSGNNFIQVDNTRLIVFNVTTVGGGVDVGLMRSTTGTLEVNNGTGGQWAALKAGVRDTGTNTTVDGLTLGHQISSGTPAAAEGIAIQFNLCSTGPNQDRNAGRLSFRWADATDASRGADGWISTVYNGGSQTDRFKFTQDGRFTLPTAGQVNPGTSELGSLAAVSMYVKGSKIVLAFNNAGTITYATWDMTQTAGGGTGVWVSTTTAP